jgi:hypothetical protein
MYVCTSQNSGGYTKYTRTIRVVFLICSEIYRHKVTYVPAAHQHNIRCTNILIRTLKIYSFQLPAPQKDVHHLA